MNENRSNTLLLTVIAVATLLVAVVGATFAYFTANTTGGETASTITVTGGEMNIAYADGSADVNMDHTVTGIEPKATAIAEKQFTLTGNNSTDIAMPYTMELVVVNTTFYKDSLTYTLEVESTGGTPVEEKNANTAILGTATADTGAAAVSGTVDLGSGSFAAKSTDVKHTYTLKIYFLDNHEEQDYDKNKSFAGYINIKAVNANA